jgi:hypothetical protein
MGQRPTTVRRPVTQIGVRVLVGANLLSASDDPLFLGLRGACGREFRLAFARGPSLRRGQEDQYLLGAADDPDTNVASPELNDPTSPAIDAEAIEGVYLRKGLDPIPNVRALGELDDRLEIAQVAVEIYAQGQPKPLRFEREGPIWLGLACGLQLEIPQIDTGS